LIDHQTDQYSEFRIKYPADSAKNNAFERSGASYCCGFRGAGGTIFTEKIRTSPSLEGFIPQFRVLNQPVALDKKRE
jgi:hypothetical protein